MHVHVLNDNANIYFKKGTHTIDFLNSISWLSMDRNSQCQVWEMRHQIINAAQSISLAPQANAQTLIAFAHPILYFWIN